MNSTLFTKPTIELWFIPLDILAIASIFIVIILAICFLFLIILDKTCHTVPMMLVTNSCLVHLIYGSDIIWMSIFKLKNDFEQIPYQDSLCIFRAYIGYSLCNILNYSYVLQVMYRYIFVVYPTHLFWRSKRIQFLLICLTWIFGFLILSVCLFTNEITYNIDNQICQLSFRISFSMIYMLFCIYIIPVTIIIFTYFKLVRYIGKMNQSISSVNRSFQARRELKVVRHIVIAILILTIISIVYGIFICMSYFTTPPKYYFRIGYLVLDIYLIYVIINLFQFSEPLQISLMKILKRRKPHTVVPIVA